MQLRKKKIRTTSAYQNYKEQINGSWNNKKGYNFDNEQDLIRFDIF